MSKQGEVTLQFLKPKKVKAVLKPTPFALRYVLTELGGARNVFVNLYNMDYNTVFSLIKAGLHDEKWGSEDDKALEESIFAYGFSDLVEPCTEYLTLLINGGREPKPETDEVPDGEKL